MISRETARAQENIPIMHTHKELNDLVSGVASKTCTQELEKMMIMINIINR